MCNPNPYPHSHTGNLDDGTQRKLLLLYTFEVVLLIYDLNVCNFNNYISSCYVLMVYRLNVICRVICMFTWSQLSCRCGCRLVDMLFVWSNCTIVDCSLYFGIFAHLLLSLHMNRFGCRCEAASYSWEWFCNHSGPISMFSFDSDSGVSWVTTGLWQWLRLSESWCGGCSGRLGLCYSVKTEERNLTGWRTVRVSRVAAGA